MRDTRAVRRQSDIGSQGEASQYSEIPEDVPHESNAIKVSQGAGYEAFRRSFDVVVVALATPAIAILIAICGLLIMALMGRPVFFVQNRVGRDGQRFRIYKLRTMATQSMSGVNATAPNDPRVTPLGKVLRQSHLDELPQLWNIFRGEMTLIGPRPEQPELVEQYKKLIPNYDLRHQITPGLTGYAQVYYGYAATVEETKIKLQHDLYYVQNRSFSLDMKILLQTVVVYANPNYVR